MHPIGPGSWPNALQLLFAGVAVMVAAYQVAVWRWEGRSSAGPVILVALCAAGVLGANAALVGSLASADVDPLMVARDVMVSALLLSILALAASIGTGRRVRWWPAVIVAATAVRLGLFLGTHLVFTYREQRGLPRYGPLMAPTSLVLVALVLGYLVRLAARQGSRRERAVLVAGIAGSLALAVVSVAAGAGVTDELLTGYLTLPVVAALVVVSWARQGHVHRHVRALAARQHALSELSRLALSAPVGDVAHAARHAFADNLAAPASDRVVATLDGPRQGETDTLGLGDEDTEFVVAVRNTLTAARHRRQAEDELDRRATRDELTGLPNRARIRAMITEALRSSAVSGRTVAVAFCNVDRFRRVNDAYGHAAGDRVLAAVAARLSEAVGPGGHLGRFGADEFVVVCAAVPAPDPGPGPAADADPGPLDDLVARVHSAFARPFVTDATEVRLTASVGVAAGRGWGGTDADTLLRDAVTAMHDAKAHRVATGLFCDRLRAEVVRRAEVERRLGGALRRGEIVVRYQPIVALDTGAVLGFEALARWRRGSTLLAPAEWMEVAESTELIHDIGAYVLATAAMQVREWWDRGHRVEVNVNVSARQLGSPRFARLVDEALDLAGPGPLCLELTEGLALDADGHAAIRRVHDRGVRVALDDFGTGYSALAAIAELPIDEIKVDKSITARSEHPDGRALIAATLAIAERLSFAVVAEGVETAAAHRALTELGCRAGQGFLYRRPLHAREATDLLAGGFGVWPPRAPHPGDG